MKRFGIIGAGRFGTALAEALSAGGADVVLIDKDRAKVQAMAQSRIEAIQGDATEARILAEAGIGQCEAVIVAIGAHVEGSVLATVNCKELGVPTVVAKATTELHGKVLERVGADVVVHPDRDRAMKLAQSLMSRTPIDLYEIADGYSVAEVTAPKGLVGKTLIEGAARQKYGMTVLAIRRVSDDTRAQRQTLIAHGTETIQESDLLVVFAQDTSLDALRNK